MVIRYQYSSARDRGLWIDDIRLTGNFISDSTAPAITGVKVIGPHRVKVDFSEKIEIPLPESFVL